MAPLAIVSLSFSLDKWYMDLVSEDGEAILAYAAEVRFRALSLSYVGLVQHRDGQTRTVSSLRRAMPVLEDKKLTWTSRALGTRATWSAEGEWTGVSETLLSNESGSVDWNCIMPLARAEIELDDGRTVRGLGYVEQLKMTVAPWDLPIEELRWGRFTADGASVVWLDWRGPHATKLVMKHGVKVEGLVEERTIEIPTDEARVVLGPASVIREGPLGAGPLNAIAELHALLPSKLLATVEKKICAPATLEQPFAPPVRGWVIAEVVKWG